MWRVLLLLLLPFLYKVHTESVNCQTPDKQAGVCIPIRTCSTMSELLATIPRPLTPKIRQKIKSYQCGFSGKKPKVCCPPKSITFDLTEEPLDTFQFPDVSNHKNINFLPKNCGHVITTPKIVRRHKTFFYEFPWMALLSYQTPSGSDFHCGGTILNENYILTAAHCITDTEKAGLTLIGVRVGEYDIRTTTDCEVEGEDEECSPPVQDLAIEQVIIHEGYSTKSHTNDVALIRVSKIDLTKKNTRPICLPLDNTGNFNYTNMRVLVTGWGANETGRQSPVLIRAELEVTPRKQCQEKYEGYEVNETQLCASGPGSLSALQPCAGDSGGPLYSLRLLNDEPRYIQQGIFSFGPGACEKLSLPGIYTRVAFYVDWILDKLKP